jgi:hypothetical protein
LVLINSIEALARWRGLGRTLTLIPLFAIFEVSAASGSNA